MSRDDEPKFHYSDEITMKLVHNTVTKLWTKGMFWLLLVKVGVSLRRDCKPPCRGPQLVSTLLLSPAALSVPQKGVWQHTYKARSDTTWSVAFDQTAGED